MRVHQLNVPGEDRERLEHQAVFVDVPHASWDGWGTRLCLVAALAGLRQAAGSPLRSEPAEREFGSACGEFIVDLPLLLPQPCVCASLEGIYREGFAAGGLPVERVCVLQAKKSSFLFR